MFAYIMAGFAVAFIAPLLFRWLGVRAGFLLTLLPAGIFLRVTTLLPGVLQGKPYSETFSWFTSLDVHLSFHIDGLSILFLLIISGIGTLVSLYASRYMDHDPHIDRFYLYLFLFMSSMLGVVASDNMIALFVFWELTSISSYLLIGFYHHKEESRNAALQALLLTGAGGLALMAGLIITGIITGTWNISELSGLNSLITSHPLYNAILVLVFLGAFTKSAQYPFHFWLPNAMEAPGPVSAYLHSATMVKAGVYLLARMSPHLGGTYQWHYTLMIVAGFTMIATAILAIKQDDLKKLLAYSTVGVLATLIFMIGVGTDKAITAMIIYLTAHSLYKGALFLVAGIVDHESGTRDIAILSGLSRVMPFTAVAGIVAALSMMGMIPFFGFIGKEEVYGAAALGPYGTILITVAIISGVSMVAVAILAGIRPFLGSLRETPKHAHEAPWQMWIGPFTLATLGLLFGLFPSAVNSLMESASGAVIGYNHHLHLHLWHGFNTVFILSLATLAAGFIVYLLKKPLTALIDVFSPLEGIKPSNWYRKLLDVLIRTARLQTSVLQNGYLQNYITIIIASTVILMSLAIYHHGMALDLSLNADAHVYEYILGAVVIMAAMNTIRSRSRLASVVSIGVVGLSIAIVFVMYGAPDLALTQFAIETLTVILFVLVLYRLPRYLPLSDRFRRYNDMILAVAAGALMTYVVLVVVSGDLQSPLKEYFAANSLAKAHGQNIVNVILVDFRGIDTMGEITVLSIAAIGVYSLIRLIKREDN